jgi:carbonic anhydrase/acetyltransferase-like protein (isoleucine patch superfamily)
VIYELGERRFEAAGDDWYVAPSADVIGCVRLGRGASVWFNAVLRGDNAWIDVGDGSNVQDGTIIHTDPGIDVRIGSDVTIGHRALLHACEVGDGSLIANGAMVLDGVRIGRECVVAAGALVPPGKVIPDRSLVMGAPGKVVREVDERDLAMMARAVEVYCARSREYRAQLRPDARGGG